jgi:hypothetical protein
VTREVNQLLGRIFAQRQKDGRTDLEAVESALRTALHQAGAAALSELLQFEIPEADQRQLPCPCGHYAQYQEIRVKTGQEGQAAPRLCNLVAQRPGDAERGIQAGDREGTNGKGNGTLGDHLLQTVSEPDSRH